MSCFRFFLAPLCKPTEGAFLSNRVIPVAALRTKLHCTASMSRRVLTGMGRNDLTVSPTANSGLGLLSVLPGELITCGIFSRLTQEDHVDLSLTSHAVRAAVKPLLSRAIRCSFCGTYLLHPRDITRQYRLYPTLFIIRDSLPPTVIAANSRFYCAECRCSIGKRVAVSPDADPVIALENGPARLVNGKGHVVTPSGARNYGHPFFCKLCKKEVGNKFEDLIYITRRNNAVYLCCYTLRNISDSGESRDTVDEQWGPVSILPVACSYCGSQLGFRYTGRIVGRPTAPNTAQDDSHPLADAMPTAGSEGSESVEHLELFDVDSEYHLLDDVGNIRCTMLLRDAILETELKPCVLSTSG